MSQADEAALLEGLLRRWASDFVIVIHGKVKQPATYLCLGMEDGYARGLLRATADHLTEAHKSYVDIQKRVTAPIPRTLAAP